MFFFQPFLIFFCFLPSTFSSTFGTFTWGESSESAQSPVESPRRRAASVNSFFERFERGVSQATQNSEGTEGREGREGEVEIPISPPKRRRWSDILHARRWKLWWFAFLFLNVTWTSLMKLQKCLAWKGQFFDGILAQIIDITLCRSSCSYDQHELYKNMIKILQNPRNSLLKPSTSGNPAGQWPSKSSNCNRAFMSSWL